MKKNYFVVSLHREENVDSENLRHLFDLLNEIYKKYGKNYYFNAPRTRKILKSLI